jgi:hypothetical protein
MSLHLHQGTGLQQHACIDHAGIALAELVAWECARGITSTICTSATGYEHRCKVVGIAAYLISNSLLPPLAQDMHVCLQCQPEQYVGIYRMAAALICKQAVAEALLLAGSNVLDHCHTV